jgi:hypothetical protein
MIKLRNNEEIMKNWKFQLYIYFCTNSAGTSFIKIHAFLKIVTVWNENNYTLDFFDRKMMAIV